MSPQELAMARDLADELAEREAELGQMPGETPGRSRAREPPARRDGDKNGQGKRARRQGTTVGGGWGDLTDAERLERLEEAARTLEQWLKDASLRAEGESAERIRELLEESDATRVVERMERIGELYLGGQKPAARREANELSRGPRAARPPARRACTEASSRRSSPRSSNSTSASPS